MANNFFLEIYTPDRVFFKGEVDSFVFNTPSGEMGILKSALPMVTTVSAGILRIHQNNRWMEASNGEGFLEVRPNKVIMLAQSAEWPYEINADIIKHEIDEMTAVMKREQSLREYKMAKAQLARHFARLRLKDKELD